MVAVCTPTTWMRGFVSFSATATPEMSPPPPIGTTTSSRSGHCSSSSSADRALARDDARVVERVHEDQVLRGLDAQGLRVGLVVVGAVEHHARAVARACA